MAKLNGQDFPNGKYINLGIPKIKHDEISEKAMLEYNILAQIVSMRDKAIDEAVTGEIIKYARENDVTDLFLLDEEFVKTALINEAERRQNPKTNFDKITESVESLAEFLDTIVDRCKHCPCQDTECCAKSNSCNNALKEWLQKEIDDE